jgi:hypothetical protein
MSQVEGRFMLADIVKAFHNPLQFMRTKMNLRLFIGALTLVWTSFVGPSAYAQGTAFSYQGHLMNNGLPANGNYDLTFTLFPYSEYGFPAGPVLTNLDTPVTGGLFYTILDFGSVFNGSNYWLEIAVRTNGNGNFTTLEPRQFITPVPYAVYAANASSAVVAASVSAGGIIGTIPVSNLSSNVVLLTASGTLPVSILPTNPASSGGITWQSPSSTAVQAQSNMGYVLTNSQQVIITLPQSPNVGDIVEIAGAGLGGWILAQNPGQTIGASFSAINLPGDASGAWFSIASSSDGTKLAAVNFSEGIGGGIWTSSDSGTNWVQTSAPGGAWYSIASSSDGMKLAAVTQNVISNNGEGYPGGFYSSSNGGTNWAQTSALPNGTGGEQYFLASSSDGTKLALAIPNEGGVGGIWTSANSGTNWLKTSAPTNVYWYSIASSSDGTKLAAVISGGGIWSSSNSGTNWMQGNAPSAGWSSIASSSNGMNLAAADESDTYGSGVWTSSDAGTNWGLTGAPGENWQSIASSADGTKLAAVINGGGIWTSVNSGTNWVQVTPPATDWVSALTTSYWYCIASSADGTRLAAGISGGGIWTVYNGNVIHESAAVSGSTMLGSNGLLDGNFGTVVELLYSGGGEFVTLYQTGSISGH